jgi:hypothetical protein
MLVNRIASAHQTNHSKTMKKATTPPASPKPVKQAPAKRAPKPSAKKPKEEASAAPVQEPARKTAVTARIDIGFGNVLYIRGEGPGLSWDRGQAMDCTSSDAWTWGTTVASRPFAFKVLINDEQWSTGDDFVAEIGVDNVILPAF